MRRFLQRPARIALALVLAIGLLPSCEREQTPETPMTSVPVVQGANDQAPAPQTAPEEGAQAALPANHPPIEGMMGGPGFDPGPPMGVGSLRWSAPSGWTERQPESPMRLVEWELGAESAGGAAECSILRFRGGGSTEDNIARWTSQFSQPDGSSSADAARVGTMTVNGLPVTTFEISGTMLSRGMSMTGPATEIPDYAMINAIVDTDEGPYFLKCTGPQSTLSAARPDVMELVQSFATGGE